MTQGLTLSAWSRLQSAHTDHQYEHQQFKKKTLKQIEKKNQPPWSYVCWNFKKKKKYSFQYIFMIIFNVLWHRHVQSVCSRFPVIHSSFHVGDFNRCSVCAQQVSISGEVWLWADRGLCWPERECAAWDGMSENPDSHAVGWWIRSL